MASQQFTPILNVPVTTIAQYNAKVSASTTVTLATTQTLVPQLSKGIGSAQSYQQTSRYRLTAYVALVTPSTKPKSRSGYIGPLKITWDDGTGSKSANIGQNALHPLDGSGSDLALSGNVVGQPSSFFGGAVAFIAAAGTDVTVAIPYDGGNGVYAVSLALETF